MNSDALFKELCDSIKKNCETLSHKNSWRFLYTSSATLHAGQKLFLIGINPGGRPGTYEESPSYELGNGYSEDWGSGEGKAPLQQQMKLLFSAIHEKLKIHDSYEQLMDEILATNYIPYRSQDYNKLGGKDATLEFADGLWKKILDHVVPDVIICIGVEPHSHIRKLLKQMEFKEKNILEGPIGWDNKKWIMSEFTKLNDQTTLLVRLPHLSTYKVFSRKQCVEPLEKITSRVAEVLKA